MGKRTTLSGENLTMSTGSVLAAFQTAAAGSAASICYVTRIEISQSATTTLAMLRASFGKRDTAGSFTVTAATPQPTIIGGAASGLTGNGSPAGAVARSGVASSVDSGGTYSDQRPFNFANLNGYLWKPDPEEKVLVPPSTLFVVRFLAAPGTLTGWTIAIDIDENG